MRQFSEAIYGRRARSELLAASLRRYSTDPVALALEELLERKRLYDEAYYQWNATSHANLLLIRRLLSADVYSEIEAFVEFRLIPGYFAPMDRCLTRAYDSAIRGADARPELEACKIRDLLRRSLGCGYEISDTVFLIAYRGIRLDDRPYPQRPATYRDEIIAECGAR